MRIHPLFEAAIWTPISPYVGHENNIDKWRKAGKPVVELEPSDPVLFSASRQLEDNQAALAAANADKKKFAEDLLNWKNQALTANARIKELEEEIRGLMENRSPDWWTDVARKHDQRLRNEALEEAAKEFEGKLDTVYSAVGNAIAERIRRLKK